MNQLLRAISMAVLLLAQAGSSKLQRQIPLPQDSGLVDGKRELVCPHSSARSLMSFVSRERRAASSAAATLYGGDSKSTWAYLDIGSASVPTLMPDGSALDYDHQNNVDFVSYWKPDGSVDKSFWARRFDRGSILTSGSNLLSEGVESFSDISASVKTKTFTFIRGELSEERHLGDLVWTNTIFADQYNTPESKNLDEFRRINEQLLDSVRNSELRELAHDGVALATTVKTDTGEQILTVFVPDQSAAAGHLVGYLHLLASDPSQNEAAVNAWFAAMKAGTRVYI